MKNLIHTILISVLIFSCQEESLEVQEFELEQESGIACAVGLQSFNTRDDLAADFTFFYTWTNYSCEDYQAIYIDLLNQGYLVGRVNTREAYSPPPGSSYSFQGVNLPQLPFTGSNFQFRVNGSKIEKDNAGVPLVYDMTSPSIIDDLVDLTVSVNGASPIAISTATFKGADHVVFHAKSKGHNEKYFNYAVRFKYADGQLVNLFSDKTDSEFLGPDSPTETSSMSLRSDLSYLNSYVEVLHNGSVVKQFAKTLLPSVPISMNQSGTMGAGNTFTVSSSGSGGFDDYDVRIKYRTNRFPWYANVHTHSGNGTTSSSITLSSGISVQVQAVKNGIVIAELPETFFP